MIEPTKISFQLATGQSVDLCITMMGLKRLAGSDKSLYKAVCSLLSSGTGDIVGDMRLIYAAYLIANKPEGSSIPTAIKNGDLMSEQEFEKLIPDDLLYITLTAAQLIDPKKRAASAMPSAPEAEDEE